MLKFKPAFILLFSFFLFSCESSGVVYTYDENGNVNNVNNSNNNNNTNNNTNNHNPEICDDQIDNDGDGQIDCDDLDCITAPVCNVEPDVEEDDGNSYIFDTDTGDCPEEEQIQCDDPVPSGCQGTEIANNGLDDNCNGEIDEVGGNVCTPGSVRSCFLGPPDRVGVGACVAGQQVCLQTSSEFGEWGPCEGGISPSPETCDGLDNDCNGCIDDGLCCEPPIMCPDSSDPSLQGAQPFTDFVIDGTNYYSGTAYKWEWTVSSGPCDNVLGVSSYTINGHNELGYIADTSDITLNFSLSGVYTITMRVYYTPTEYYECVFVVKVAGPGLRIESCWDNHEITDLDLHLMKANLGSNYCSDEDCNYGNCKADNWNHGNWSLSDSSLDSCIDTEDGDLWQSLFGLCKNPRLDLDNIFDNHGITPENINVDIPGDGDTYRIAVDYFYRDHTVAAPDVHPVVNIYCNGERVATFGYPAANQVTLTDDGGMGCSTGQLWRVADVTTSIDASGQIICNVTSLTDSNGDPYITTGNSTY